MRSEPRLTSDATARVLVGVACTFLCAPALMAVVPAVAQSTTGRPADGGLVTAITSASTVGAELLMPSLLGRISGGRVFAAALLLLGLGALGHLAVEPSLSAILALSVVRGAGFGACTVTGSVLVAELAQAHARGRAIGNLGLVVGISSMISPPVGLVILGRFGADWVWVFAGAVALIGVPVVVGVANDARPAPGPPLYAAFQQPGLMVPVLGLALLTATYGGLVSFAPQIMEPSGWGSAATFFLAYGAARATTRWSGGHAADRFGHRGVLVLGLLGACLGLLILPITLEPLAVVMAGVLYGGGSGMAQSAIFVGMLERASSTRLLVPCGISPSTPASAWADWCSGWSPRRLATTAC